MELRTGRAARRFHLTTGEVGALGHGQAIVRDGFLGMDLARQIAIEVQAYDDELRPARMGRAALRWFDVTERGDEITWIEPADAPRALRHLWRRFELLRQHLNRSVYLGLRRFDLQLARYRQHGARYARHADAFRDTPRRRATAIYYANPWWEPDHGGVLRLYEPGGERDVAPLLDRLVLFLSDRVEHEVLPSYAPRTALTAWYYDAILD